MASPNPEAVYLKVFLHYNGVFFKFPVAYTGGEVYTFTDVDFAGMDLEGCGRFLERFVGAPCERLYYCIPDVPLGSNIKYIKDDLEYAQFIITAYEHLEVSLYMDHIGEGLSGMLDSRTNTEEDGSVVMGEEKDVTSKDDKTNVCHGLDDEIVPDHLFPVNDILDDEFLTKLCPPKGPKDADDEMDEEAAVEDQVHPTFNETIHWKKQVLVLGMRFENPKQLKNMLCNYAVANGYQLCFKKNDRERLLVLCCEGDCTFRLWASWMSEEHSFQIKSLKMDHQCARNYKLGSIVTYAWIGEHYTKEIMHRQKLTIRQLRLEVIKKFGIDVSLGQCRRAKKHAMSIIEGTLIEHYAKLWSYAEEIRRTNPGSTVKMDLLTMPDGKRYFSKFYVCFEGIKKGWIEGCRRVVGIDGCFLKGVCCGELLCAVGKDANNGIFPIAWAVVCVENKENWKWFLELLVDDLNLGRGHGLTIMSDQHKGIIEAVKDVLPAVEHRQCARHIAQNFKKRFGGAPFENLFWKASNATTETHFKEVMKELHALSPLANKFLMDKNPKTWSRAYYETGRCCASTENGTSESFNAVIVEARKKPIITMLEELRLYMLERLQTMKEKGWTRNISPAIRQKLGELKIEQRYWQVLSCGMNQFETRSAGEAYTVDLEKKTCSCRLWQLNGFGCVHSVSAICYLNKDPESYVDPIFSRTMYLKSYNYCIFPMNGSKMWPETNYNPPLPPKSRRKPGRPTVKRKRCVTEISDKHRVSKKGKRIVCSNCHEPGHNIKSCARVHKPTKLNVRRPRVINPQETTQETVTDMQTEVPTQEATARMNEGVKKQTRKRKSERIIKAKLAKNVVGKNGAGNTSETPVNLE